MILHYIELVAIYALALIIYWELLEINKGKHDHVLVSMYTLPVIVFPLSAIVYWIWFRHEKTDRVKFGKPINLGLFNITTAFVIYYII